MLLTRPSQAQLLPLRFTDVRSTTFQPASPSSHSTTRPRITTGLERVAGWGRGDRGAWVAAQVAGLAGEDHDLLAVRAMQRTNFSDMACSIAPRSTSSGNPDHR
jgi:hypothetical protein